MMRAVIQSAAGLALLGLTLATTPGWAQEVVMRASRAQLQDAWLSADVAVVGTYMGVDAKLGEPYHRIRVTEVWMGAVPLGDLLFKAPRTARADSSDETLLFLWDRLAGATDSFIEASRKRHGEDFIEQIGPDSLATYLLPFDRWAFPFTNGKMVLQGTSVHKKSVSKRDVHNLLLDYELTLQPKELYASADVVVRARITSKDVKTKTVEGVAVEYVVTVDCEVVETLKGEAPNPLQLTFGSFPRSPRFDTGDDAILFLQRTEDGFYLHDGKRSVLYITNGTVAATGEPVVPFIQALVAGNSGNRGRQGK